MAIGAGAALYFFRGASIGHVSSSAQSKLPVIATLPEFVLVNERGESTGLTELHGTVWIADFIFTRCGGTCPMITHRMSEFAKESATTPALKDVKFVSFSVDPDFDRPDVLREYGRANEADPARWTFLTGTSDVVHGLIRNGFKLPVDNQDDKAMPILHSEKFVVVDRLGRVRGAYEALTAEGLGDLRRDLTAILAEPKPTDVVVPADAADPKWIAQRRSEQTAARDSIAADHDFQFTDRIGSSGIAFRDVNSMDVGKFYTANHYDHGTALAVADVDGDGLLDLYFVNQAGKNRLYRNLGGGRFEDITDAAGVGVGNRASVGAAFADIDNDGYPDLFVTSVREGNILFRNDGHGHFSNITSQAGVAGNGGHSSGAVFFDYDGDGLLDLFVTNVGDYTKPERRSDGLYAAFGDAFAGHLHPERYETSLLYHNLGHGKFELMAPSSGLVHRAWSGDVTAFDFDGDGRPDVYVPAMQGHNQLYRNLGAGHFENTDRKVFPATPWGAMGVKVLDWNGDGLFDLFVTDMHTDMSSDLRPEDERRKHDPKTMFPPRFLATDGNHVLGNALFTNQGHGRFTETSDSANVETGWPWGPSVGDLNADGWPDIFVAAGMNFPFRYRGNDVLLNESGKRFANAEFIVGVEPRQRMIRPWFELDCDDADVTHDLCQGEARPITTNDERTAEERGKGAARHGHVTVWAARASRSAAILDLDNDGDLDIVTNNYGDVPQIFISDLAQRRPVHFLKVRLVGVRSNRDGVGAVVSVHAAGRDQFQVNDGKSGYLAQSVMPLYFGLGAALQADSITVKWPTGKSQVVSGPLRSGSTIVVKEQ
ncbi:MAG TPA: FG-GAP-like repeat-containing protein [Vicinamibacterales bacterium]|nr:FG-GAP-like repeat-containing protein [Vicinamibacterales bacterium]